MTVPSRKSTYNVTAAFLCLAFAACNTDAPTAARPLATPDASLVLFDPVATVGAALRTTALASDVVATAVIGSTGGSLKVPGTGFELKVPAYAVMTPTTFQVTALAGPIVAYEFEPHGTRFLVPVRFSQETKYILGGSAGLFPQIGYFSSRAQLAPAKGLATVSELLPTITITDLTGKKLEGFIFHFSGYLVSSGRTATPTY